MKWASLLMGIFIGFGVGWIVDEVRSAFGRNRV